MGDIVYCRTGPVGPGDRKTRVGGEFRELWEPPMHRHVEVAAGDRVGLLWRDDAWAVPKALEIPQQASPSYPPVRRDRFHSRGDRPYMYPRCTSPLSGSPFT